MRNNTRTWKGFPTILWILLAIKCLTCQGNSSMFRLFKENASVGNGKLVIKQQTNSEVKCFMTYLQSKEKCCIVQIEPSEQSGWFTCSLFSFEKPNYMAKMNSSLFSIVDDQNKCTQTHSCMDLFEQGLKSNGVYEIPVNGKLTDVFCDMESNGGGWTVIQKRFNGSVSFDHNWQEYKNGFGNAYGEYWLGNELIHQMSKDANTEIKIVATRFDGDEEYIIHDGFWIESESNKYRLHTGQFLRSKSGSVRLLWSQLNNLFFTTKDSDNDKRSEGNCATMFSPPGTSSGWWFGACSGLKANGVYSHKEDVSPDGMGIVWFEWKKSWKALKTINMAIRSKL